jgi:hypothetical protein
MLPFSKSLFKIKLSSGLAFLMAAATFLPNDGAQQGAPPPPPPDQQAPVQTYAPPAPVVFADRIPGDQLAFLNQLAGAPSGKVKRDKQFRKLTRSVIPDCTFHYGRDMSLSDALDMVMDGSKIPVEIRDGRYLIVSGSNGPYLAGRGFIWIDMQEGIGLGGFYFHPTNGEPTPIVAVFSRQVRTQERSIGISQLPAAFAGDLQLWSKGLRVPFLTTSYLLTVSNKRILLEHDEDYCAPAGVMPSQPPATPSDACERIDADAADIDMEAASYLKQVNYATNATAWMIADPAQVAWIAVRENTCRVGPDPLRCRIRMTRERTHLIIR